MNSYIESYLDSVDEWIENYIGRSLKDGSSATKYYDLAGGREVWIDDFEGDPSSVVTLDLHGDDSHTLVINDDYITKPLNETIKNRLVLRAGNKIGNFSHGTKRLKVTASFGAITIPADLVLAATMLMASILTKYDAGGVIKSEKVGDTAFSYKDVDEFVRGNYENQKVMGIYSILDQYRLPQFA